ncbi:MAG TPA: VWA domain-containing protein [Blastocatellia bacterium]
MKHARTVAIPTLAIILLIGSSVLAQRPARPAQPQEQDDQVQIRTFEVRLPISVKNKDKFVTGLTVNNFEIYEDGKRQKIEDFKAPSQLPLYIAMLVDTSNSVKLKLPFEKDAGEDFIATVTTFRRKDKVLLASFDSEVALHQDFTDDQQSLIAALRKLKAGGVTRMRDAVYRIIEEKLASVSGNESRRVIVVLSDGEDTASERSLKETIDMAQRHDVTIFGISTKNFKGITSGMVENEDDKELRKLCESTGGQVFLPSEKLQLFKSFSQVAQDLRLEYVLFYKPENQDKTGKPRQIRVKLVNADGRVHHKQGYIN